MNMFRSRELEDVEMANDREISTVKPKIVTFGR